MNPSELAALAGQLRKRLEALEEEAYAMAGRPFNISSPSQVGQILFGEMAIDPKARKTKGAWSTAEDVLEKYASTVPLVRLILDIRGLRKLLTTYVEALPKLINPSTRQAARSPTARPLPPPDACRAQIPICRIFPYALPTGAISAGLLWPNPDVCFFPPTTHRSSCA